MARQARRLHSGEMRWLMQLSKAALKRTLVESFSGVYPSR